ncbi:hypothetical protein BVC80_285g91 [Macleaya cordata]|uniref:Uncharacterized protein n=1 Tax=Macleaya cordata TaxID=56857 RepID=A0A200QSD3_MACCD|nr:hypothetical protein BVC80_285g91 [Macleaya cordata]
MKDINGVIEVLEWIQVKGTAEWISNSIYGPMNYKLVQGASLFRVFYCSIWDFFHG